MNRLAALVVVLASACDVPLGQRASAIVNGQPDSGDPAVVAIVARHARCEDPVPSVECTGTLIAPHVVLTAAHCLIGDVGAGSLEIYAGAHIGDVPELFFPVAAARRHPAYDPTTKAYDLAVLFLEADAPGPYAELPTAALDASAIGAPVRVVGFGVTHVGTDADGQRRDATMTLASVAAATFTTTPAPGNSCGGDSGGPVLVTTGTGEQLLGVTSSGDALCTTNAIAARLDVALDFARAAIAEPPPTEGRIPVAEACGWACDRSADCPAAMQCLADEHGAGRCQIAALPPGDLGKSCTTDTQCGDGTCAWITAGACRCLTPCSLEGCAAGGGAIGWLAALFVLSACRRRRSTRRAASGSTRADDARAHAR